MSALSIRQGTQPRRPSIEFPDPATPLADLTRDELYIAEIEAVMDNNDERKTLVRAEIARRRTLTQSISEAATRSHKATELARAKRYLQENPDALIVAAGREDAKTLEFLFSAYEGDSWAEQIVTVLVRPIVGARRWSTGPEWRQIEEEVRKFTDERGAP